MDSEDHRKKYELKTKYRISASDGSLNNETVFELEEVTKYKFYERKGYDQIKVS